MTSMTLRDVGVKEVALNIDISDFMRQQCQRSSFNDISDVSRCQLGNSSFTVQDEKENAVG